MIIRRLVLLAVTLYALSPQMAAADSTALISVSSAGVQGNAVSSDPSISADGRFVAFTSKASNLIPGDTNASLDVFVRDRLSGTTRRVSVDSAGVQGDRNSFEPATSGNGRFVAFSSDASNLDDGAERPYRDIFVHDRLTGTTDKVNTHPYRVCGPDPWCFVEDQGESSPTISFDGGRIAFVIGTTEPIFERSNLLLREINSEVTTVIRRARNYGPSLSADGRVLAWECQSDETFQETELCVEDLAVAGASVARPVTPASKAHRIGDPQYHRDPSVSADGRFVAYWYDDQLAGEATVFLLDRTSHRARQINLSGWPYGKAFRPSISADGRFVAYAMYVETAIGLFVWDRLTGSTERIDKRLDGSPANAVSDYPSISADGRFVAFTSNANGLVAGDTNKQPDVFIRDRRGRDDVLVDFGANGLWQFMNNRRWIRVNTASPGAIAVGDINGSFREEALGTFPAGLLARYENVPPWKSLLNAVPVRLAACDLDGNGAADIAADRGASGLWIRLNRGAWVKSRLEASRGLTCGDLDGDGHAELVANLGAVGLWALFNNTTWVKLQAGSPLRMIAGDLDGEGKDDLIADFGSTGVFVRYNNRPPWQKIRNATTQRLAVGDLDGNGKLDLLLALPSQGLWVLYNNTKPLVRIHTAVPKATITADLDDNGKAEVLVSLPTGLWARYNNTGAWQRLHTWPLQSFVAGGFD